MRKFTRFRFILKCMFISGFLMFVSMAAGEIFVDNNLFSGFLHRPSIWHGIFLESGIATFPVCLIGLFALGRVRTASKKTFLAISLAIWMLLGSAIIALYKIFYWSRDWHLTAIEPGANLWLDHSLLVDTCFLRNVFDRLIQAANIKHTLDIYRG
jgi:hypothetical protein